MNKSKIYALIVVLLSFGIVFGGWFLTKALLVQKREAFLERTGQVALQSSETALLSEDWPGEAAGDLAGGALFEGESLSEDMIAEVLAAWENGGNELPHEPKRGQMNMEQAIDAGKDWIAVMAEHGIVPEELAECDFDKVTARLCTLEAQVDFDENLLSYWSIQFTEDDVVVSLTVHAASGEIWKANILMNEHESLPDKPHPEEMLKIAFPFIATGDRETANLMNNTACVIMRGGLVYAAVKEQKIAVDEQEPVIVIDLWLSIM